METNCALLNLARATAAKKRLPTDQVGCGPFRPLCDGTVCYVADSAASIVEANPSATLPSRVKVFEGRMERTITGRPQPVTHRAF